MKGLVLFLLAAASAVPAAAGTTSITITQRAQIEDGQLVVEATLGNRGDEAALTVTPTLHFGGQVARGKGTPRLDEEGSFEETLSLPVEPLGEGRWPYQLVVDYTDGNLYAFQALQAQTLVVGSPPPAKVVVAAIIGGDLAGDGTLTFTVRNLTPEPRSAQLRVLLPEAIEASGGSRTLPLDAWGEARLEVPITNRSALVGSRYPVFVSVEYDDGAVHQAMVAQGQLAIVGVGTFLGRHGNWLSIAGLGLLVVWLAYLGASAVRRRPATPGV